MTGRVRYEVDDRGVAFVTLDAPESRNALSVPMTPSGPWCSPLHTTGSSLPEVI
jgi:hypothetical protein